MSTYIFTHGRTSSRRKRIQTVKLNFFVGKVSLMFMLTMLIGLLSVVFLVNANNRTTYGYEISKLENERDQILNYREQQNVNISKSQSRDYIMQSEKVQRMVPVSEIHYSDREGVVALR